jgi:hypothetical protein
MPISFGIRIGAEGTVGATGDGAAAGAATGATGAIGATGDVPFSADTIAMAPKKLSVATRIFIMVIEYYQSV